MPAYVIHSVQDTGYLLESRIEDGRGRLREDFNFLLLAYLYLLCYFYNRNKLATNIVYLLEEETPVLTKPLLVGQHEVPFTAGA